MKTGFEYAKQRQTTAANGGTTLVRFRAPEVDVARSYGLRANHPALAGQGRTLFPGTVTRVEDSPRLLVSGHNNPKLGRVVMKGPWRDRPIYHLSLEERASCPRSCALWADCYGNAMHRARRHDHRDPAFLPALRAELSALNRRHPSGFVVRLHTLGDFYSVDYVRFWADMLDELDALCVFGYTARREDADDEESRRVAKALRWLSREAWSVFALRFSGEAGPCGAVTLDAPEAGVLMCPAQTHKTEACATCGLCWSASARDRTIGFLRHGMRKPWSGDRAALDERNARARALYEDGASIAEVGDALGLTPGGARAAILKAGGEMRSRQEAQRLRQRGDAG